MWHSFMLHEPAALSTFSADILVAGLSCLLCESHVSVEADAGTLLWREGATSPGLF